MDEEKGLVELKAGKPLHDRLCLIPDEFVEDIEASLLGDAGRPDEQAIFIFCEGPKGYGYDRAQTALYRSQPGFAPPHLAPALYPEESLDRLRLSSLAGC